MRKSLTSIAFGILLIIAGIILFGNQLNYWDIDIFFEGWWTLIIIIPCLINFVEKGWDTGNFICLCIGVLLLLLCQDFITWSDFGSFLFPIIIIVIGFSLIFRKRLHISKEKKNSLLKKDGTGDYTAIFSGVDEIIEGKEFKGAIDLNLKDAKIKEDIMIESTAIFGGNEIILPSEVNVEITSTNVFGGYSGPKRTKDPKKPTVYITTTNIFGGLEIK